MKRATWKRAAFVAPPLAFATAWIGASWSSQLAQDPPTMGHRNRIVIWIAPRDNEAAVRAIWIDRIDIKAAPH